MKRERCFQSFKRAAGIATNLFRQFPSLKICKTKKFEFEKLTIIRKLLKFLPILCNSTRHFFERLFTADFASTDLAYYIECSFFIFRTHNLLCRGRKIIICVVFFQILSLYYSIKLLCYLSSAHGLVTVAQLVGRPPASQ